MATTFARRSRSWPLVKASTSVLRQDKELLVFLLVSMIALGLVRAADLRARLLEATAGQGVAIAAAAYTVSLPFYFSQYFVIFLFSAALVGAVMIRLDGGNPTLGDSLRIATSRIGAGYALIAATVGMILHLIKERVGFVGKIIVSLLGVGWTIAIYLVMPVLVARSVAPIDAVKESPTLLKKTWDENVIGQAGPDVAFTVIFMGVIGLCVLLMILAVASQSVAVIVAAGVIALLAVRITGPAPSALSGIYAAALYRYATAGKETQGVDTEALKLAFAPK